jgi:hypothetical protein
MIAWILIAAAYAIPRRRGATTIILLYLCFALLFSLFVPSATNVLLGAEHLTYRNDFIVTLITAKISVTKLSLIATLYWPLAPILVAPLVDLFVRRAQQQGWSRRKLVLILTLTTLIAGLPVTVASPFQVSTMIVDLGMSGQFTLLGVDGFLISLFLAVVGTSLGTWFGLRMGESLQQGERS